MPSKLLMLLLSCSAAALAQDTPKPLPSIAARTATMKHMPGLLPLDWDAAQGKLYLEIPNLAPDGKTPELLYTESLAFGAG